MLATWVKTLYSRDLVTLSPLLVCIIICLFDPPPNRWQSWRDGAKRQVTFQSLTPAPIQPWSMEDMIHLDFNIVLGTEGRVFVTTSALKSYTLKLEMATSIFINSLVHESIYIPNFRIDNKVYLAFGPFDTHLLLFPLLQCPCGDNNYDLLVAYFFLPATFTIIQYKVISCWIFENTTSKNSSHLI